MRTFWLALPALMLLSSACGSETDEPSPDVIKKPVWSDAPAAEVTIGQGQSKTLPLTIDGPEGSALTVSVTSPSGVEVEAHPQDDGAGTLSLHADYVASGALSFDVTVSDAEGEAMTTTVSLNVKPIAWLGETTWTEAEGPEAREHASMIVDPDGTQAFLFAGSGYSPYLEAFKDVHRYETATDTWTSVTPTGDIPTSGGSKRVAEVPGTKVSYLWGGYGGQNGATLSSDLHRVTIEGQTLSFKLLDQVGPPEGRGLHAFIYDAVTDRFILFGGASSAPLGDTWVMTLEGDTAKWKEVTPKDSPSARYGFFHGFNAKEGKLIVFSGAQGFGPLNPAEDTWALDVRADPPVWELVSAAGSGPPGRRNGCSIFDPSGPRLFVFGGTPDAINTAPGLFVFDARSGKSAWTTLTLSGEPELRSSGIGFYDVSRDRTLFGFGNTAMTVYRDWTNLGYE